MNNISAKKRLMYLSGEDFYHYCYSIFVILKSLGCINDKYFRDYRKLAFLTDVINDDKKIYIISRSMDGRINSKDHEFLLDSYTNGLAMRSEILKLLFVLEKRGYVRLARGKEQEINVSLCIEELPKGFLSNNVFESEFRNIKELSEDIGRLASLTLGTMLSKIYVEKGIKTWA